MKNFTLFLFSMMMTAAVAQNSLSTAAQTKNSAQTSAPLFKFAALSESLSFSIPQKDSGKKASLAGGLGLELSFRHAEARIFADVPNTPLCDVSSYASGGRWTKFFSPPRWGTSISLFQNTVSVYGGMISYSGSVSKLRNPAPQPSSSPLRASFAFSPGLNPVLPSLSSSEQPLSVAAKYTQKNMSAQYAVYDDSAMFASMSLLFPFSRWTTFESSFTGGRFYLQNDSAPLWKAGGGFSPGWFYACVWENAFRSPAAKLKLNIGIHATPWGPAAVSLGASSRTAAGPFLFDISLFGIPTYQNTPEAAALIGAGSDPCRTIAQCEINPQLALGTCKFGVSAAGTYRTTAAKVPVKITTAKFGAGFSFERRFVFFRTEAGASNILINGDVPSSSLPEKNYSASADMRFSFPRARTSCSAGISYCPPLTTAAVPKVTYKGALSFTPGKQRIFTTYADCSVAVKNGKRQASSAGCSASIHLYSRFVRCIFKCAAVSRF